MRFQKNGKRIRLSGKIPGGNTKNKVTGGLEINFVGMQKNLALGKKSQGLSKFSYYDPEKKICKLCYEDVTPHDTPGGLVLLNTVDGKPHRVFLNRKGYCKMSMRYEA